jgi:ribosome-associated protein
LLAAKAALEKKASDLVIFHVAKLTTIADYFLICSAESQRQVKAILDHVDTTLAGAGESPFSVEGDGALLWVLLDYSDLIIHIFKEEIRPFYALERLWGDAPRINPHEFRRTRKSVAQRSKPTQEIKTARNMKIQKG